MIRQDILGGLKLAMSKGESLKQAMMSFYNAGYKKNEIEDAARALSQIPRAQKIQPVRSQKQQPKQIQKVSDYEQKPPKLKQKLVLFLLIFILIILLGILTSVFIFKSDVIDFLNRLIGI